jgi:hypothetical protein
LFRVTTKIKEYQKPTLEHHELVHLHKYDRRVMGVEPEPSEKELHGNTKQFWKALQAL